MLPQNFDHGGWKTVFMFNYRVVDPKPFSAVIHPSGIFQVGKVSGSGRLGESEGRHDVANAKFPFCKEERQDT